MKKHFSTPGLITIAILTIITAVFWTFFSVLRIFMTKEDNMTIPEKILAPLNPQLNDAALESLSTRRFIEESQIPSVNYSEGVEEIPLGEEVEEISEEEFTEEPPEEAVETPAPTPAGTPAGIPGV